MRMLIAWSAFLFLTYYEVYSLADYPIGRGINVTISDNNSITSPMSLSIEENSKVDGNNRVIIPKRIPRDLNAMEKMISATDNLSSNNTAGHIQTSNHNDASNLPQNNTWVTSANSENVISDDAQKFSNNTPRTHETIVSTRMDGNATHYTNKFSNVMHVQAHPNQLVNDTTGNHKLLGNNSASDKSIATKKRHVDQMVPGVQGQRTNSKCPMINSADIKNAVYMKSLSYANHDGSVENLICTKTPLLPDHTIKSIVRKMDHVMKTALARVNSSGGRDDNDDEEKGQDHEDENEDEYEDDDEDDDDCGCGCGCGCGCKRTSCCGCRKNKRKKCPTGVTVSSGSGRRSGATYPINYDTSETTIDSTTPIETTELPTTTPSMTTTPTTSFTTITTTPLITITSTTPSTTTTSTTPSTTTTSTTPAISTSKTPSTTTISTTPLTTTTEFIVTTTTTSPLTPITPPALPSSLRRTSLNLEPEKKRNGKRKKCTKKKRRKDEITTSESIDENLTANNDKVMNVTEPTRVPFSGLLDTQPE